MSTQTTLDYRTNRDLFSNYHLDEHLPETEAWNEVDEEELQAAYDDIKELWDEQKDTVERRNESQLEEKFIRPMFRKLGIPFEVEESANETQRRPDYGFFETEADATDAFQRREDGGDFYKNAIAVADAKRWGRKLDTRGEKKRDYENPSHQIDQYLRFTSTTWGVLTNGQKWRLYYKPTSHKLDSYYEIDLPTVLETGSLEEFKYFYLFFRHEAFVPDASGDAFLDDVYEESNLFAQDLGQDLQDNIYDAIVELSEGFLQYPENDLDEDKLDLIHDSSLIYLYRIIFILYAEAEGRDLLDTNNEIYESQYSLNQLKQEVAEELESGDPKYRDWQDNLHSQLDELFTLIDQGSKSRGIPEEDLYIPAYNGGLFRTNPDESGSKEARFLADNVVGDEHLARVIELLTRSESSNGAGKIFVDYSSLDIRHLGSIYEGLLEYQLNVANEPLALDDGEYIVADADSEIVVERNDVYLTTDSGERKATGSYYTPEYVVEYIVNETLEPIITDIREDLVGYDSYSEGGFADEFAERVFDLKILDPAMGSGHFLTSVVNYLAREVIDAQEKQAKQQGVETIEDEHDINWARRKVSQRCIYGVDVNPLATELAKVSLWLRTLAAEQPLAFLDHHLKTGNSLVGSDIREVLADDESNTDTGQLTLEQSFAHTRKQALDHVMDRFSELLAIDNETLEDAKEMEEVYQSVQRDPLYQKLLSMANVHTASQFGLDIPSDADKRMAEALRDDSWEEIEGQDWFRSAQVMAKDEYFFHWELEFPVVFYTESGTPKIDEGFDAVIGNPPWGHPGENKDYLKEKYSNIVKRLPDNFSYFAYKSLRLCKSNSNYGVILPNVVLFQSEYSLLRNELTKSDLRQVVDLGEGVFEDAVAPSAILLCEIGNKRPMVDIRNVRGNAQDELNQPESDVIEFPRESILSEDDHTIPTYRIETRRLMSGLQEKYGRLGQRFNVEQGVQTGGDEEFTVSTDEISDYDLEREFIHPVLFGSDITPFVVTEPNRYLLYIDRNVEETRIPNIVDYLEQYRDSLESVSEVKKGIRPWYTLHRPRDPEMFDKDNILLRQTGDTLIAAVNRKNTYTVDSLLCITQSGKFSDLTCLCLILNSSLLRGLYDSVTQEKGRVFSQVKPQNVKKLPLPRYSLVKEAVEDMSLYVGDIDEFDIEVLNDVGQLSKIHNSRVKLGSERSQLTMSLMDYLGNYNEGHSLPDTGLFQPAESSILNMTTEEYEKLRVGELKTERDDTTVKILATARYKPENEEEFETDAYGYTETDYKNVFTLTNLSENEAALIEAFVPVACKKADGFANFRDNATKTNSLIDRVKNIVLPDIDDVSDDLERYIQVKERADELDQKIEKMDDLIDKIVYNIYGLTDEEIRIVESATEDN